MATQPTSSKEFKKDTLYIDVDDEITMIIEKLQNSPQRIVALVLPKRASVLQSVVNMKLLKRTADNAKKHVVLITSESGLLPLAGAVGLHVASSLQSKPAIPVAPDGVQSQLADSADNIDEDSAQEIDDFDPDSAADQPIGKLAGGSSVVDPSVFSEPETIQMEDDESDESGAAPAALGAAAGAASTGKNQKKKGANKKLKIPNFNKFRMLLLIGIGLLVLLIGGFIYANVALSKATITLKTNSSDIATKANLTLDPGAAELDVSTGTVPAKIASKQLTGSQQVSTSGSKNNGTKASGSVTLSLNDCSLSSVTVPAGTGVSAGGQTFITQSSATMIRTIKAEKCANSSSLSDSTATVSVVAQTAGAAYNIAASKFAVAGFANVTGQSSTAFTGGTDNIVKVVTQADIDSAKQRITGQDSGSSVKGDLSKQLSADGYTAIAASLHAGSPVVTPSASVGDQADTVTVSQATTYTMYGAKSADIKRVITTNVRKQIDTTKQQILKDGADSAKYEIDTAAAKGPLDVVLTATSLAGPDIQTDKLAIQLAGKKTGAVQSAVKAIPGVSDASVKYSPFWVSSVPNKSSRVHFVIEKSAQATQASDGSKP